MRIDFSSVHISPEDVVDQSRIPRFTLYTGDKMPVIGLGTYHNEIFSYEEVAKAVYGAVKVGYRLVDCASGYKDEPEIGQALARLMEEGIPREELFITSKLDTIHMAPDMVIPMLQKTLGDLRLDYLDGYYIHWPFPGIHLSEYSQERHPDAHPFIHEEYMDTWREMERAVELRLVRNIGTSNLSQVKYERFLRDARIRPSFEQLELHPCFSQTEFVWYLKSEGILPVAYSPIGAPNRPEPDANDVADIAHPILKKIAATHGVHPAVICLKWAVQRGTLPIPFAGKKDEYLANIRCVTEALLSSEEMGEITKMECGNRLNKGVGFLWRSARDWHDIWDE